MWCLRGLNLIKHATVLVGSERSIGSFKSLDKLHIPVTGRFSLLAEQIEQELNDHDVVVMGKW